MYITEGGWIQFTLVLYINNKFDRLWQTSITLSIPQAACGIVTIVGLAPHAEYNLVMNKDKVI
jgi:hypothetical protein